MARDSGSHGCLSSLRLFGNLLCAKRAFQAENLEKLFYKLPLLAVSFRGLIVTLVLGGGLMLSPQLPGVDRSHCMQ